MSNPPDGAAGVTRRRAVAGIVVGCAVLVLLGAGVLTGFGPMLRLDDAASRIFYVGDHPSLWVHDLLAVETAPGLTVVRIAVCVPIVAWLMVRRAWWSAVWVAVAVSTVAPLTTLLKDGFDRVRPQFRNGGARLHTLSFPSGHSSGIATFVVVVLVLTWPLLTRARRRVAVAVGVLAIVVVGLGRMWQGVHYLTDVLGGWAFGTAWALALALAFGAFPGGRAALRERRSVPA